MQKIVTHLWFDNNLEEAIELYTSLFEDSKLLGSSRYPEGARSYGGFSPEPGSLMSARFQMAGQEFMGLNGGPAFKFNESVSLFVNCGSQAEVDRLWDALTADGGEESQCGWLKDRFGLSWQIIPKKLGELMSDPDPEKSGRVMEAMLKMRKIDTQQLQDAYDGKSA